MPSSYERFLEEIRPLALAAQESPPAGPKTPSRQERAGRRARRPLSALLASWWCWRKAAAE